jgi:hypothetical protein
VHYLGCLIGVWGSLLQVRAGYGLFFSLEDMVFWDVGTYAQLGFSILEVAVNPSYSNFF